MFRTLNLHYGILKMNFTILILPFLCCAETARAFDQLQVRSAPHASLAASPSDSGADQPPSPKKRKAAGSLRQDSSTQRSGNDQEDTLASQSGPVGELLQEFGQIQLNKDFYDAIARTESCAGKAPLSSTRADVDRAAFEAAVGAATAVLRTQVKAMAEEGEEASPAFLQAYALNAISIFATQGKNDYQISTVFYLVIIVTYGCRYIAQLYSVLIVSFISFFWEP